MEERIEIPPQEIEIRAWNAKGQPLASNYLQGLYFLDLKDEPLPNPLRKIEPGRLLSFPPKEPFAIAVRFPVEGFGEVTLYADNQGKGYTPNDFPLNLNLACARTRLHRVQSALSQWTSEGNQFSKAIQERLSKALGSLKQGEKARNNSQKARLCNDSLKESLWAGEEALFEKAQQDIQKRGRRPGFLFGCNFFGHPRLGPKYDQLFKELFNFATVPLYWKSFEPQPGRKGFDRVDEMVNWLLKANITPKGHPLVWFHDAGIPEWLRQKSFGAVQLFTFRRVAEITHHYQGKISYYDIINEAHDWANELGYSQEQLLEMTRLASQASRAGNPQVQRIINNCCLWAEYVATGKTYFKQEDHPLRSPFQYLKACISANIGFEIIGLQLYYPGQDMLEIHRLLERFSTLGKPIHITELGVSSSPERDEGSLLKQAGGLWHAPWSEKIQADWVEQFYTLCFSKPYIHAITWWDFADSGHFWPYGGFLRSDLTPKESYHRLKALIEKWKNL